MLGPQVSAFLISPLGSISGQWMTARLLNGDIASYDERALHARLLSKSHCLRYRDYVSVAEAPVYFDGNGSDE